MLTFEKLITISNTNLAQRAVDTNQCPNRFLKSNIAYGFFAMFPSITQVQSHYSLYSSYRDWKGSKQLCFCFCSEKSKLQSWKTNWRIVMKQATNVTSLSFKWKKTTNVLRVSRRFWSPYSCNRSFCGRRCCKTSICISCSGSR